MAAVVALEGQWEVAGPAVHIHSDDKLVLSHFDFIKDCVLRLAEAIVTKCLSSGDIVFEWQLIGGNFLIDLFVVVGDVEHDSGS